MAVRSVGDIFIGGRRTVRLTFPSTSDQERYAYSAKTDDRPWPLHARQEASGREIFSAGADARAAACVQPRVHRMRPNRRVQGHDPRHDAAGRGAAFGGRSRRADRVDLRRRAADVQAYRGADARADRGSEASRDDLHQRDPARALRQAGAAESVPKLQPASRRDARDQRSRDRSGGAFRHRREDDQDAEGEGLPRADQHDGVPRDQRARSSRTWSSS